MERQKEGYPILSAKEHVDLETGFLCRYINSDTEVRKLHGHEFYEIFMGINGKYIHEVNGVRQQHTDGTIFL